MSKLLKKYQDDVAPSLMKEFKYNNIHQCPKVTKVVLNMGLGEAVNNPKVVEAAAEQLSLIAGQKSVITKARTSIAGFKLREGMQIGTMVTLRRDQMWDFLDRLVGVSLPRVRDFRGLSPKAFDGAGNFNLGLKEQIIFPEIDFDKVDSVRGLNVTIVTSAKTDEHARELLKGLGFPFREQS